MKLHNKITENIKNKVPKIKLMRAPFVAVCFGLGGSCLLVACFVFCFLAVIF
jgi:hypothetical protein